MSAALIMRILLRQHAPLTALVPAAKINVGTLPQGTALPAIDIREISGVPKVITMRRMTKTEMIESRVQVTVFVKEDYAQLKKILQLAKLGQGMHKGVVGDWYVNSIIPIAIGPEIPPGDDKIFEQSRDFMVTFAEAN